MEHPRSRLVQAALVAVCLLIAPALRAQSAPAPQGITRPVNNQDLVTLRGNVHPLALARYDHGPAPDDLAVQRLLLVLQRSPQQQAALDRLLVEQQTQSSPNFHKWLTPEQFGQQFGPSDADLQVITNWLGSQGFQVNQVSKGRAVIEFSGTAGEVRAAFHTQIHQYLIDSKTRWANSTNPEIPAALAPVVAGIDSLNNFPRKPQARILGTFTRSKATGEVRPLFTYPGTGGSFLAVGPGDFATIYNVLPLWNANPAIDGSGQTIAVVAESNIHCQDVADFRTMFGLPYTAKSATDPCPTNFDIVLNGPDPGILVDTDEGEADLDAEWAGAIAKNADVKFVVSETPTTLGASGVDLSALYIIDNNLAGVLSDSYGQCELDLTTGGNQFYNAVWEQAAAEGITVVVAGGDSGSAGCDDPNTETAAQYGLAVSGLASTPFNVAIGGTDFNYSGTTASTYWSSTNSTTNTPTGSQNTSAKSYIPELTWNDSCEQTNPTPTCNGTSVDSQGYDLVAGGGGPSNCTSSTLGGLCTGFYPKPVWQTGAGVPPDSARDLPDVSLFASDGQNGSFYVFCQADQNTGTGSSTTSCNLAGPYTNFQGGGGTSFGAPAFAGIMALVNQKTGERQGNANFVLYKLAAKTGASCASNSGMAPTANASSCVFYDTPVGSNISVACKAGTPNCSKTTGSGYGVLMSNNVNDAPVTSPAWPTTANYDLATGLGTVNVANLVNNWNSVTFTSINSITLTLTPPSGETLLTLKHGQSVGVTVNVSPSTATGDVTLLASANSDPSLSTADLGRFPLSGGAVSSNTTLLPGGTYNVTAHYAGDGTYAPSDSAPVPVTVSKESSKTAISLVTFNLTTGAIASSNAATAAYGSPYVLRVDVTNSAGNPCSTTTPVIPCPSGQVTITDNSNPLKDFNGSNVVPLNEQGFLEDQPVQFPAGSHPLAASYAGDNSYTSSVSLTNTIAITQASTSTAVTASPASNVSAGDNVTLTATVSTQSNSDTPPSGTVQFLNNNTNLGGPVNCSGTPYSTATGAYAQCQAQLVTSFQSSASITAKYIGDTNYAPSAVSPAVSVSVTTTPPDYTLSANPASVTIASAGQSGTSTITAVSTNGVAGNVNFTCTVPAAMKEAGCTMNPTSSPISQTANTTSTLTVTTTAPHTTVIFPGPPWLMPAAGAALLVVFLLLVFEPRRRRKLAYGLAFMGLLAALSTGCGGGSNNGNNFGTSDPGTPAGTYSVTVTGTSGATTHSATVSVTVQ
jgi:Pro-kumamolisin, activation domain/Bacterial Ig-like domain (group 3)